ncbi:MAG: Fe-S cluster assembly protein SufD [Acidimicrobiia bacterium]|nr:Fe-S cluster assembly protein SufD [Acidimicrobiia bacterium]
MSHTTHTDPPWLARLREEAGVAFAELPRPTESMEEWRHTDPREIPFDAAAKAAADRGGESDAEAAGAVADALGARCGLVVSDARGIRVVEEVPGIEAAPLDTQADAPVGDLVPPDRDVAAAVNAKTFVGGLHVRIAAGTRATDPLVVVHVVGRGEVVSAPRTLVEVGTAADVSVVEVYVSGGAAEGSLAVPVSEAFVADGAALHHVHLQCIDDTGFCVAAHATRLGRDCRFTSTAANLGAHLGRARVDVTMAGEGSHADMYGVFVGDGDRHVDFRSEQAHVAPRCTSRLLYKGAVWDRASAVYSGLVRIDPDAARSDAHQAGHYLILSEDARAAVIPNLEIHNHDVACGHAASGGPPDEDQIYYLEARGIDEEAARHLVVDGFFSDVIDRIPLSGVRAFVESDVFRRLGSLRAVGGAGEEGG